MSNWKQRLPLVSVTQFTLQDFPGRPACIMWFTGCQMRCPYCHNPDFALGKGTRVDVDSALRFLQVRSSYLDGVVLSGGECLMSEAIVPFAHEIKQLGYLVKVDTNGASAPRLKQLLSARLIDYVAMDFKAPIEDYGKSVGWESTDTWERSFELLRGGSVDYELRTTVHPDLLDEASVDRMFDYLELKEFRGVIYLQHFQSAQTLGGVSEPTRRFDLSRVQLNRPFKIRYRNFTDYEVNRVSQLV